MAGDVAGLVLSLVVLALTGDQFIIGVARLAGALRVRPTVVGALVGGFGTSIAELIVAALAAGRHSAEQLALGSLMGSIIANVCLGLTIAALITPVRVDSGTIRREAPLSVASVALFALLAGGGISRADGVIMAVALVPVVVLLFVSARRGGADELGVEVVEFLEESAYQPRREVVRSLVSLAVMLGGAELMVTSSVGLANHLGFSQGFAGLTLVGVGTSAPLIASSIQAARRAEHDLVVGNVLGGNLFIALGGGALVGLIAPGHVAGAGILPLVLMVGVVLASWLAMARRRVLARSEALVLLIAYAVTLPFVNR